MPIYDYLCSCGCVTTEIQKIGSNAPRCEKCGGVMRRRYSPIAMVKWKGEGGFPSLRKAHKETATYTSDYGEYGD